MKNTLLTILGLLLIIGMGVGGYFLGWYLDKVAGDKQQEVITERNKLPKTYTNPEMKIKFVYPGTWTITQPSGDAYNTIVTVTKDNGTEFVFLNGKAESGTIKTCDEADPNGTTTGSQKCTFQKGTNFSYGRFEDSTKSSSESGKFYGIAEPASQSEAKKYIFNSLQGFYYKAVSDSDLTELDNIMKSVERLK